MSKTQTDSRLQVTVTNREVKYAEPLEYEILSDKKINLTKARAFEFLEMATFAGERAVRELHVQFLYDEHTAGRFLWHQVLLASAVLEGVHYRINGQHTCWMRVNIPDATKVDATCRAIEYKVKDSEQLRALYSAFDRNAPRTYGHVAMVQLLDTEAGAGIPQSYFRNLVAGFRQFCNPDGIKKAQMNPNEVTALISDKYKTTFNIVGRYFMQNYEHAAFIRRSAVVGAMLATFNVNVAKADEFWTPVVTGLGLAEDTDPRYRLRTWLIDAVRSGKKYSPAETQYRVCIIAWNNWLTGKAVKHITMPSTSIARPKVKERANERD